VWQIRVAAGEQLPFSQSDIKLNGHAIECRINAENAATGFSPSTGTVAGYVAPGGPGIRVDSHLYPGYVVPPNYDSLIGKIIAWGTTRDEAVARMRRALSETLIVGIDTTIPFYSYVLAQPEYASGKLDTSLIGDFVSRMGADLNAGAEPVLANAVP
ncbi:MAG TPA: hypothetical protein VEX37_15965, partial [Thermomicrobiales bacterium]|nr:hypothetical protein [Thermomicrobiales bacterium]